MGVLSHKRIVALLKTEDLIVSPCLAPEKQISESSIDLRLGYEFIVMRRTELPVFGILGEPWEFDRDVGRYQRRVKRRHGQTFILHPDEFVLGASLEYVVLPSNIYAQVLGKSTLGRLGLVIATAVGVGPQFKGCITLELRNLGALPVELIPGMRIAQLVFYELDGEAVYDGRYRCPTGPQFPKLVQDDSEFWSVR